MLILNYLCYGINSVGKILRYGLYDYKWIREELCIYIVYEEACMWNNRDLKHTKDDMISKMMGESQ